MQTKKTTAKRKTAILTPAERKVLEKKIAGFVSVSAATDEIKINRSVLDRVRQIGKASPENIEILRNFIAA